MMTLMMAGTAVPVRAWMDFMWAVFVVAARIGPGTCDEIMISRVRAGSISVIFVPRITITAINKHHRNEYDCNCE
ncbi:hypothetical protein [Paenibacillus sp. FSL P2-0136]|uniref:hypothetical protein n=1 Tax=Paenibacillus sp. FSL P2-0136 TaxID=2975317 RepID=UPI0030DDBC18